MTYKSPNLMHGRAGTCVVVCLFWLILYTLVNNLSSVGMFSSIQQELYYGDKLSCSGQIPRPWSSALHFTNRATVHPMLLKMIIPRGCSDIFIHMLARVIFWGGQNFEFQYFGCFREMDMFWGMKIL